MARANPGRNSSNVPAGAVDRGKIVKISRRHARDGLPKSCFPSIAPRGEAAGSCRDTPSVTHCGAGRATDSGGVTMTTRDDFELRLHELASDIPFTGGQPARPCTDGDLTVVIERVKGAPTLCHRVTVCAGLPPPPEVKGLLCTVRKAEGDTLVASATTNWIGQVLLRDLEQVEYRMRLEGRAAPIQNPPTKPSAASPIQPSFASFYESIQEPLLGAGRPSPNTATPTQAPLSRHPIHSTDRAG